MRFQLVTRRPIDANPVFVIIEVVRLVRDHFLTSTPPKDAARWQDLMAAAQQGDQRAYATLLKEAVPFIRVIARRYQSNTAAIEDIVQEALLTIHRMRHTYEPGRPAEPWIAAIAKARAIDALRKHKRRATVEGEMTPAAFAAEDGTQRQDDKLSAASDLNIALAALPPSQRAALQLLKIEERSLAEASLVSGQSVPALKSLLHRAMQTLRTTMKGGRDA